MWNRCPRAYFCPPGIWSPTGGSDFCPLFRCEAGSSSTPPIARAGGGGLPPPPPARGPTPFTAFFLPPRWGEGAPPPAFKKDLRPPSSVGARRTTPSPPADLVLAADAMVYLSDLTPLL